MTARLSEGGFEFRKDITVYIFSDEAQRLKDWSPFDVLAPVAEMYIRGTFEVEVLIGVLISREPVEYLKYRALFHCERSLLADLEAGEFTTGHVGRLQNDDAQGDGNNASMKDAMFINVREFTQQP